MHDEQLPSPTFKRALVLAAVACSMCTASLPIQCDVHLIGENKESTHNHNLSP